MKIPFNKLSCSEDLEIKEETLENFEDREVNDTDQNNEDTRDGSQITETVSINPVETSRNPVIISLKPTTKRKQKQLEDSESGNENSPKKSKSMPVFSCTVCGLKCHSQTLLVQHVHMIHNNVKTLQCVGCEKGMQYILIKIHIFFYSDNSNTTSSHTCLIKGIFGKNGNICHFLKTYFCLHFQFF